MAQEQKNAPREVTVAIDNERAMSLRDTFRFWPKAIAFSLIISLTVIMEVGHDVNFSLVHNPA